MLDHRLPVRLTMRTEFDHVRDQQELAICDAFVRQIHAGLVDRDGDIAALFVR